MAFSFFVGIVSSSSVDLSCNYFSFGFLVFVVVIVRLAFIFLHLLFIWISCFRNHCIMTFLFLL